jgi:2-keto-4-pentenoate hydratase/2-oxohepta-3-ene-1,7-dioic acid hydratase in catechol pathway
MRNHRGLHALLLAVLLLLAYGGAARAAEKVVKYVRFRAGKVTAYGVVEGDTVHQISPNPFVEYKKTGQTYPLAEVKLLAPTRPTQVLAMAGNYRSHLSSAEIPEKLKIPQAFFKTPTCIIANEASIVIPPGADNVHFEGEMVIVIGKRAKSVAKEHALEYVLGVTCGNDVSARDWQKNDVQWWRAKGSDTFGPCGPVIVSGINYDDLQLRLRLNGEVKQEARTKEMIHDVPTMVSYLSRYVTLHPGDLIYTGTPGRTSAMKPGDVVEVEIEGIGILRNKVTAAK